MFCHKNGDIICCQNHLVDIKILLIFIFYAGNGEKETKNMNLLLANNIVLRSSSAVRYYSGDTLVSVVYTESGQ